MNIINRIMRFRQGGNLVTQNSDQGKKQSGDNSADNSGNSTGSRPLMGTVAPVARGLILICEKCGKKLGENDGEDNVSRRLQKDLKFEAIERFGKKQVRAMVTSCMDVCPKDRISACVIRLDKAGNAPQFFEFDPQDSTAAKERLLSLAGDSLK